MSKGSGRLGLKYARTGLYPLGAAHIVLDWHSRDSDGNILLTPECATYGELEANVNLLKKDLDGALAAAKKKFDKAKDLPIPPLKLDISN